MIPWPELKALGGLILMVMAVDVIAFAVMVVRAL
jgi:hypothetical protein